MCTHSSRRSTFCRWSRWLRFYFFIFSYCWGCCCCWCWAAAVVDDADDDDNLNEARVAPYIPYQLLIYIFLLLIHCKSMPRLFPMVCMHSLLTMPLCDCANLNLMWCAMRRLLYERPRIITIYIIQSNLSESEKHTLTWICVFVVRFCFFFCALSLSYTIFGYVPSTRYCVCVAVSVFFSVLFCFDQNMNNKSNR